MRTYDFSPLFRHSVGFDHIQRLLHNAFDRDQVTSNTYPPYNIESTGDDSYRVSIAVAGFNESDLNITVKENTLSVEGHISSQKSGNYLFQGIAGRNFKRNFSLADYVKVVDARLENGLLHIDLLREMPEALKPQTIKINSGLSSSLAKKAKKLINTSETKAA